MTLLPLCGDQKVEDNGQQGTYAVWLLATQPEAEEARSSGSTSISSPSVTASLVIGTTVN